MTRLLLASPPIYGHVLPMTTIGAGLRDRGHDVALVTGRKYRELVEGAGLSFCRLPAEVDYDDADIDAFIGAARPARTSLGRAGQVLTALFIETLRPQYDALQALLNRHDVVVADTAFLGMLPLLMTDATDRPPVLGVSVTPLSLRSVDSPHFGSALSPGRSAFHLRRNAQIDWLLGHGPLRPIQRALDRELVPFGAAAGALNYFDVVTAPDLTFHLGPRSFEYPRREMPDTVRFVGPLRYPGEPGPLPPWWGDVLSARALGRRIVHVTQGTLDTADPGKLIVPALRSLAGTDVLVVASTGGRPIEAVTRSFSDGLPTNARVADFLPYDALLPHCDVVVTNGGYGGVLRSLASGIPLVVAGAGEDKPEVAARVAWTQAGVNLRTDRPSPRRVRRAVERVLADPAYRRAAARVRGDIENLGDPITAIAAAVSSAETRTRCLERTLGTPCRR